MQIDEKTPIKIIYNWIGPGGPIVNTEVPNILSITNVAENCYTDSHKFWADDIYWRVFMHHGNFPYSSSYNLSDKELFIYPLTLSWRTEFQNYFIVSNGVLEFSHTPNHVISHVRGAKGFILIDYPAEAWVKDLHLNALHSYFNYYNNISMGKIIYVTGCMNAKELYDDWCLRNNIPDDPKQRMILISFPISQHSIRGRMSSEDYVEPTYNPETIPSKLFLCWNRRFRPHRLNLALALNKAGLIDRSYYSMTSHEPELNTPFKHVCDINSNPLLKLTNEDVEKFISKLPLIVDGETDIVKMCQDFDRAAKTFYEDSLISIITETNFEVKELTATEKTWKPAKEKHPFIIVGTKGALKALHNFGFKTFNEFWDESYDDENNPNLRLHKIVEICKEIGTWNNEKILDFKRRVQPILEHNYAVLKSNTAKKIAQEIRKEIIQKLS